MQPNRVDRVIRRVIRLISRMASEPNTAAEKRQPKEFSPKSHSPPAMIHFPSGGITTYSPPDANMCVLPDWMSALALCTGLRSTPNLSRLYASLA